MEKPNKSLLVTNCVRRDPIHVCDNIPCDPNADDDGDCPDPFLCKEKIKNPALQHEITRCLPGASMNAMTCEPPEPDHPCDPLVPCSLKGKKRKCSGGVTLCYERIKNPEEPKRPITSDCDPTK